MATGVHEIADEAVRRARAARGFLVVFLAVVAMSYTVDGYSDGRMVANGIAGLACFLASVSAVGHGYRYGHREGRTVAYIGLALTTGGIGLVVALALRPQRV